ncbi:MAG TPA: nucleotidyl transferase AbiEii/AbiGii toxin family protein [Steroidobacteraceae bacterium]|nr:nucleotidyl transferase AbiEii/AbiGii toxin family protein [Steroidobacteraceae bacterium]
MPVRAIGVIAQVDTSGMMPAFSGGTSLSKAWGLIKRFSEDSEH